jgi:hypothetical protein
MVYAITMQLACDYKWAQKITKYTRFLKPKREHKWVQT